MDSEDLKLKLETLRVERWKVIAGVLKVLITVGAGTLAVALVNASIQSRQIAQQVAANKAEIDLQAKRDEGAQRREEVRYLGEYLVYALEDDIGRRIRFADYFSKLVISKELKDGWSSYLEGLIDLPQKEMDARARLADAVARGDEEAVRDIGLEVGLLTAQTRSLRWESSDVSEVSCPDSPELERVLRVLTVPHASVAGGPARRLEKSGLSMGPEPTGDSVLRPQTIGAWDAHRDAIVDAAREFKVPVELLLTMITFPYGFDRESGLTRVSHDIAAKLLSDPKIDSKWVLDPRNSIRAGAAFLAQGAQATGFDPILVSAQTLIPQPLREGEPLSAFQRRLAAFISSRSLDVNRFVYFFNDAVAIVRTETPPPAYSFASCLH